MIISHLEINLYQWRIFSTHRKGFISGTKKKYLLEIKETGISIEKFEKFAHQTNYTILHNIHYLINPIYEYKFNLKPKIQFDFIKAIPWVRNFFTTCVYYLITPNTH